MPEQLAVFKSLQHPTRLEILQYLGEHPADISYSDLLHFCEHSTGKLNYHLRILDDLLIKTDLGYNLSDKGTRVLLWLEHFNTDDLRPQDPSFERPEIIMNKIYPARELLYKNLLAATLFALPFLFLGFLLLYLIDILIPLLIVISLYLISLPLIRLYYKSIWYRITETEVEVFKGIITHTHKIVPFRTITNIDLKAGPLDRSFGISSVNIHTAGYSTASEGAEEQIVGMIEGEEIKDTIIERIRLLNPLDFLQAKGSQPSILSSGLHALHQELVHLNKELNHR